MIFWSKISKFYGWSFVLLFFVGILGFQNCGSDEVGFSTDPSDNGAFGFEVTRKISIDPNSSENRPKIHLTTVMDNSFSTDKIHSDLIAGFTNAIDQVKGFNVEADLYTTSHDESRGKPSSELQDLIAYVNTQGQVVELPGDQLAAVPANTNYVEKTVSRLSASWFTGRKNLSYNFASDNFEDFKQQYVNGVAALGTDGDPIEKGLCTILKKAQESQNFSDPDNKSYHVYLLATNEDDQTDLSNCPIESRQETKVETKSKNQSCNSTDPDCRFKATIEQKPTLTNQGQAQFSYKKATVKMTYTGVKFTETFNYTYDKANHGVNFEKQLATTQFRVKGTCYDDSAPYVCPNFDAKSKVVIGACAVGATERDCVGGEWDQAASLFGVGKTTLHACKVKCTEEWKSDSLANNLIPNKTKTCSQSVTSCSTADSTAVINDLGTSLPFIRNCSHTCSTQKVSGNHAETNKVLACTRPVNDSCTSAEKDIAATKLGVPVADVKTCTYQCASQDVSSSKTLPVSMQSSPFSCAASDSRPACNASDIAWLASKKPGFDVSTLKACKVTCSDPIINDSVSISSNGLTCPSTGGSCSSAHKTSAANKFGGTTSDVISCTTSCNPVTTNNPSCVLSAVEANFCGNISAMTSQCGTLGMNDLDTNKCSLGNGSKTITEQTLVKGPVQNIKVTDLAGVPTGSDIPIAVADYLKSVHGTKGFYAGFILHPSDDPSCVAPAPYTAGVRYEELADYLGPQNANTFPVCSTDYSPALGSVIEIAIENVLSNFNIDFLNEYEFISKVEAVYFDGTVEEIPANRYEVFKSTLIFKDKKDLTNVKKFDISITQP